MGRILPIMPRTSPTLLPRLTRLLLGLGANIRRARSFLQLSRTFLHKPALLLALLHDGGYIGQAVAHRPAVIVQRFSERVGTLCRSWKRIGNDARCNA